MIRAVGAFVVVVAVQVSSVQPGVSEGVLDSSEIAETEICPRTAITPTPSRTTPEISEAFLLQKVCVIFIAQHIHFVQKQGQVPCGRSLTDLAQSKVSVCDYASECQAKSQIRA